MRKVYNRIPKKTGTQTGIKRKRKNIPVHTVLSIWYWVAALFLSVPGVFFHLYSSYLGVRMLIRSQLDKRTAGLMILFPMDTTRYFEFDFLWKSFSTVKTLGDYLDVSSPRLFSVRALNSYHFRNAVFINPVASDLMVTEQLIRACGLGERCEFRNCLLEDLDSVAGSFDTIVSISVIEHIPGDGDREAVKKMWKLLRPGGRLLLSVPCSKDPFEEYLDFNEYGLLHEESGGFVFGQRFYDNQLLEERIYCTSGKPHRATIYGEIAIGVFKQNRELKFSAAQYPYWREPYMMGKDYKYFDSITDLPGWGVMAMEFIKK